MLFDSASRLAEIYFQKPPIERLALMRDYVTMAREGNTKMREILSNSYLMDKKNDYGNPYKGKRGRSYGSLAQSVPTARDIAVNMLAVITSGGYISKLFGTNWS